MARNEEGELELILGNRQLLMVFFILMILLGVFYAVGYIVGRNSAPVIAADIPPAPRPEARPLVVESAAPPATETAPEPGAATPPAPLSTAPQQPPEPPARLPEDRPAPPPAKIEAPRQESAKASEPAPGQTFLQLSATQRPEAEVMVDLLKKRGFRATTSAVPDKPGLYRVLVGPLTNGDVNKTRADLQAAGFPGDKAIRKTF